MKTTCLTIEFLGVTGETIQVTSDFEGIQLIVSEHTKDAKDYVIFLNEENCDNIISSLKLAIEHNRRIK